VGDENGSFCDECKGVHDENRCAHLACGCAWITMTPPLAMRFPDLELAGIGGRPIPDAAKYAFGRVPLATQRSDSVPRY
jgi:hypothetical protein